MRGPLADREPALFTDEIERRYAVRETRTRLHQARFRGQVLPAHREQCAICRLKEVRLLDAAHIVADPDPHGRPAVANGLSLCTIHHRAFDEDLVGVTPDYDVRVSRRLLEEEDGPMLELLKRPRRRHCAAALDATAPRPGAARGALRAVRSRNVSGCAPPARS